VAQAVNIARSETEILACYPVMHELRNHISEADFLPQVKRQAEAQGYRLAYIEDNGHVVAVAGFHIEEALAWGKYMYVYDLVTSDKVRSSGHGRALMDFLKAHAKEAGCAQLHLDSGVQRFAAHKFYLREGMVISCHHFQVEV
jgi:GNAT superfamily N-acetyltransferase